MFGNDSKRVFFVREKNFIYLFYLCATYQDIKISIHFHFLMLIKHEFNEYNRSDFREI